LTDPSSLIIRTSAFFSPSDDYNFLHWVAESLNRNLEIPVANDIRISPTYVPDLTNGTLDLLIDEEKGIWHLSNKGIITWADLAYIVAKKIKHNGVKIKAVPSSHLNWLAKRPKYSVLGTEKGYRLPDLDNALDRYFIEKQHYAELII
jgi:dTDP-4-dehydrorhamnose reductase